MQSISNIIKLYSAEERADPIRWAAVQAEAEAIGAVLAAKPTNHYRQQITERLKAMEAGKTIDKNDYRAMLANIDAIAKGELLPT